VLARSFVTKRIDHKQAYSLDGPHTNNAESFFVRLRRMVRGQHHFVSPKYLHRYAAHAAWLEDHRALQRCALLSPDPQLAYRADFVRL
jgi:ISXO2-like transposase domain